MVDGAPKTGLVGTGHTAVVVRNAVHDIKRGVVVGEGGVTTEDHTGGSAGAGRGVVDRQTGHLAHEGVGEGDAATAGQLFGLDVLHRVTQGFLLTGDTEGGHDDLVQQFAVFLEDDVCGCAVKDILDSRIADAAHLDGGTDGNIVDRVGTIDVRDGAVVGPSHDDTRTDDGADIVGDSTGSRTVLGGGNPCRAKQQGCQQG